MSVLEGTVYVFCVLTSFTLIVDFFAGSESLVTRWLKLISSLALNILFCYTSYALRLFIFEPVALLLLYRNISKTIYNISNKSLVSNPTYETWSAGSYTIDKNGKSILHNAWQALKDEVSYEMYEEPYFEYEQAPEISVATTLNKVVYIKRKKEWFDYVRLFNILVCALAPFAGWYLCTHGYMTGTIGEFLSGKAELFLPVAALYATLFWDKWGKIRKTDDNVTLFCTYAYRSMAIITEVLLICKIAQYLKAFFLR